MPIAPEQVPALIKAAEVKQLHRWKRDYFDKIARMLQVHTKGQLFTKVDTVFPNEHPDSKAHCLNTYEPITKSSIWKGINNLLRIFSSSSFSINVGDQLTQWLDDYETDGHNLLHYFLETWVHKAVAEDPNGIFVVYPPEYSDEMKRCPVQFVRSELLKAFGKLDDGTEFVAFVSEQESDVEYHYERLTTKREIFFDPKIGQFNGREWTETTYNERLKVKIKKEVVHLFTREGFIVYRQDKKNFTWDVYNFADELSLMPLFPGGGPVADTADQPLYESFVSDFVPFGNLALLQHRNHRAVDLNFSYPRMSELQVPCDQPGCTDGRVKCKPDVNPQGWISCPKCGPSKHPGWVTIQSPYKVYQQRYDPNDGNENKHLEVDPVKFYSPDAGIIQYSKDAWKDYLKMAEEAIFVQQRVYTGQVESAESKEIDLDELYAWLLNVAKTFYSNLRHMLQALEEYLDRSPRQVTVEKPYSFAILTEAEAFIALDKILLSKAPIVIKANQVEAFVNKFVSKGSPVIRALRILKQYDPLLFYSDDQVASYKATNVVSPEMVVKHVLAYPIMLKLYEQDKTIFDQGDQQVMTKIDQEITALNIQTATSSVRQSLLANFNQPPAA